MKRATLRPRLFESGILKATFVHALVCLDCGFVAPHVDQGGLEAIRAKAGKPGKESRVQVDD